MNRNSNIWKINYFSFMFYIIYIFNKKNCYMSKGFLKILYNVYCFIWININKGYVVNLNKKDFCG